MTRIGWEKRVNALRQEITQIRSRARMSSGKFQELQRQAECCKIQFLTYEIDTRCKSLARNRGAASITQNGKGLPLALGITAAAAILGGRGGKDRHAAFNMGISGFNGALQGLGKADWAVCLGRQLAVVPRDNITSGQIWFTCESVRVALNELEQRAQNGARLRDLDAVIFEVKGSKKLVAYITLVQNRFSVG